MMAPDFPTLLVCTGEEWRALLRKDTPKNPCIECKDFDEGRYESPDCVKCLGGNHVSRNN